MGLAPGYIRIGLEPESMWSDLELSTGAQPMEAVLGSRFIEMDMPTSVRNGLALSPSESGLDSGSIEAWDCRGQPEGWLQGPTGTGYAWSLFTQVLVSA